MEGNDINIDIKKTVFVSYSWDNQIHKEWVLNFSEALRRNGIKVLLDQYDLNPGKEMTFFMHQLSSVDKIITILTPGYKEKADKREGGVGHEYTMISAEYLFNGTNRIRVIPVLRIGQGNESCPYFMRTVLYHDMRDDSLFEKKISELVDLIYEKTELKQPPSPIPGFKKYERDKSVAVLPFLNLSSDPEQDYFSDGIAEEILNSLSNLSELKVAGRSSSFIFKGRHIDFNEVKRKLGVSTVLEGSVRKSGTKLRINAKLVDVENGFQIWSQQFDRELEEIFNIQEDIAHLITDKMKIFVNDKEKVLLNQNATDNKEAYDLYLKGRFYWNRRGPYIGKAIEYFKHAVLLDPAFAKAHAGIADCYALLGFYSVLPPKAVMPKARLAAEDALRINASLVEAQTVLAFVTAFYDWNWSDAKIRFESITFNHPDYAPARYWKSLYLSWVEGKYEDAIAEAKKGTELEPLIGISFYYLAVACLAAGKYESALEASRQAIDKDANSPLPYRYLGISLARLGRFQEAVDALKSALLLSERHQWIVADLAWVYSEFNQPEEVQKLVDELEARAKTEYISGLYLAEATYSTGNIDKAFEYLQLAFDQKDGQFICCLTNLWPVDEVWKNDQRFVVLLNQLQMPDR
jgi:adenylate cyclase